MIFDPNNAAGFFMGLAEGGLSFGAEITLTYNSAYQSVPMIGVYVVVELERPDEAVLGRITAVSSHGKLASSAGEDLGARSVEQRREMPEDIKRQFLRYRCSVRLLGLLRDDPSNNRILFTPSHRRLPHMGAKVSFADGRVLQAAAGALRPGRPIGFLAFGEFVYAHGHNYAAQFPANFQIMAPCVEPCFDASAMVSRRTAVLARSGFGKSNLLKILFARLYENGPPTIPDRNGAHLPVGTLVFDPDGDYFWPGSGPAAPPGLCDITDLADQIVLATDRQPPSPYYGSFRVTGARLDLRNLSPRLVVSCAVPGERQGLRGTEALYRLSQDDWNTLIDAAWLDFANDGNALTFQLITQVCRLRGAAADATAGGIRSTLLDLVAKLHDPASTLVQAVELGLRDGKLVIVDLSLMRGQPATSLASILLRHIFERNVREHTVAGGRPLPVIALIEEAQKVLENGDTSHGPFVEWVKEGRKYNLGAVLVTQQPGAISQEILSQADNFFVFHLVAGSDLNALRQANGHFSDDILSSLLNEPIEGQGVFWSSAGEQKTTYPIPFRAYNFGSLFARLEPQIAAEPISNYASTDLHPRLRAGPEPRAGDIQQPPPDQGIDFPSRATLEPRAEEASNRLRQDPGISSQLDRGEIPQFVLANFLRQNQIRQRGVEQYLAHVLTHMYGLYGYGWELINRTSQNGNNVVWIRLLDAESGRQRLEAGDEPRTSTPRAVQDEEGGDNGDFF